MFFFCAFARNIFCCWSTNNEQMQKIRHVCSGVSVGGMGGVGGVGSTGNIGGTGGGGIN